MPEDIWKIEIGSDLFRRICMEMHKLPIQADARYSPELLSGGFKFSDEFPLSVKEQLHVMLPAVSLMRILLAYRRSLVEGRPRQEFADYWQAAMELASDWPGFTPHRSSRHKLPAVRACNYASAEFRCAEQAWEAQ